VRNFAQIAHRPAASDEETAPLVTEWSIALTPGLQVEAAEKKKLLIDLIHVEPCNLDAEEIRRQIGLAMRFGGVLDSFVAEAEQAIEKAKQADAELAAADQELRKLFEVTPQSMNMKGVNAAIGRIQKAVSQHGNRCSKCGLIPDLVAKAKVQLERAGPIQEAAERERREHERREAAEREEREAREEAARKKKKKKGGALFNSQNRRLQESSDDSDQ